jgi:hypothetical protein
LSGYDGQEFYPVHVDAEGSLRVASKLDLVADLEVSGSQILNRRFAPSNSGDNVLVAVGVGERLKLFKMVVSPSADMTGEIVAKVGATGVGGVQVPKAGGQYVLVSCFPDYEYGADGEDLIVNLPSPTAVTVNVCYEVVTV